MQRTWIVVTFVVLALVYGGASVWMGAYWRSQGPILHKMSERDGDILREQLENDGRALVVEKVKQAGIEEARVLSDARISSERILAVATVKAAEAKAVGEKTSVTYLLDPMFLPSQKFMQLRKAQGTISPGTLERKKHDLLMAVYESARDATRKDINYVSNGMIDRVTIANRR